MNIDLASGAILISFTSLIISSILIYRQIVTIPKTNNKMRYFRDILLILDQLEEIILTYNEIDKIYYIETLFGLKGKKIRSLLEKVDKIEGIQYSVNHKFKDEHKKFLKMNSNYEKLTSKLSNQDITLNKQVQLDILKNIINAEMYIESIIYERKVKHL